MSLFKIKSLVFTVTTTIMIIVVCYIFLYAVQIFIADQFVIPTWSMSPTLVPGDHVVVNKLIIGARIYSELNFEEGGQELKSFRLKGIRRLRHNDIIVFNYPLVNGQISFKINYVYCKRCVAVPGDTLSIIKGHYFKNNYSDNLGIESAQKKLEVFPNDEIIPEIMNAYPFDKRIGWTIKNMGPLYIPRSGDIMSLTPKKAIVYKGLLEYETGDCVVVDWSNNCVLINGKVTVTHKWKHNYYFMAGDNVYDSSDSRYWGLVPEEYIIGVVQMVSYSKDKKTDKRKWELRFLER